ncbi:hypothetical protein CMV24_12940 [Pseudomonas plecoglossicida]|uniref:Uncharacterized protein n=1 Tax=Pseudomonas plecoglossicida TaxID=70775 RepID=A0A2A3M5J3_PSEDL|nr:hypothetical protein CMV24_12940 [Pseudomonas plecoglossicida]
MRCSNNSWPVLASSRVNPLPQVPHQLQDCANPVGAGLPAKGPAQAKRKRGRRCASAPHLTAQSAVNARQPHCA